jgi:two-component system, OmpR family, phosphate regulon sensor histidine kinase PhoR
VKNPASTSRILLVLLLFVLLPAVFYSAYEINALSTSEQLVGEVYRRQLDAVLFSVNQYAYDAASSWANTIASSLPGRTGLDRNAALDMFLRNTGSIRAVVLSDIDAHQIRVIPGTGTPLPDTAFVGRRLRSENARLGRLVSLWNSGYRKLEGLPLADGPDPDTLIMLAFVASPAGALSDTIAGIVLNPDRFVRSVLAQKITEGAGEEFQLAVFRRGTADPIFTTGTAPPERYQRKQLWLFPHLSLGIQLRGTTIEDLVRSRFRRNLVLILMLDAVLLAGAWLVYRTLRQQIELVRLKSDFVSSVSHELRTPLSLIRMFAETLELGRVDSEEKKREYYATILQETERLTRLINNILNFSRMEAGKKQYSYSAVDVNDVVRQVAGTYAHQLGQSGFTLTEEYAPNLPAVTADREGMAECIINVLDNAIKYSGDQRVIAVRTGAGGDAVYVEVEDHGIGIAPEHHRKIFEKFFRVSSPTVRDTKGSGLGLSLVRHILDAHGGDVLVRSTPDRGSTFRLLFPVNGPASAEHRHS